MNKDEIEKLKSDHFIQMVAALSGISIDEIIAKYQKETEQDIKENDDENILYPFSVGEFKQLVYKLQDINREENKLIELGVSVRNTAVWAKTMGLIEDLLEIIFNPKFAVMLTTMTQSTEVDPDEIAYDLIDYLNNE